MKCLWVGLFLLAVWPAFMGCGRVLGIDDVQLVPKEAGGRDGTVDDGAMDEKSEPPKNDGDPGGGRDADDESPIDGDSAMEADVGQSPLPDGGGSGVPDAEGSGDAPDGPSASDTADADDRLRDGPDGSDVKNLDSGTIDPPRLVAPLSTSIVTSQKPTLHWQLAPGTDGASIEIIRCMTPTLCGAQPLNWDVNGTSIAPGSNLPQGVYAWRAFGRREGVRGKVASPRWLFTVKARSAAIDTSWGSTLDANGDGFADAVISSSHSRVYFYPGGSGGLPSTPSVTLMPTTDFEVEYGFNLARAGDLNGDGFGDILIGSTNLDEGRAYAHFGRPSGFSTTPDITYVRPPGGSGNFGQVLPGVGDINGDGFSDVLIASAGELYVYMSGPLGVSKTPTSTLPHVDGGAGVGDVNGDGFADIVTCIHLEANYWQVSFYLGQPGGISRDPSRVLVSPATHVEHFGATLASAGDVNGDGYADVLIGGASWTEGKPAQAYIHLGSASGLAAQPATILDAGTAYQEPFVGAAGDLNGDGYDDLALGQIAQQAFVYYGGPTGLSSVPAITLQCTDRCGPIDQPSAFGFSVSVPGDFDGDGYADLLLGAHRVMANWGQAYAYRGSPSGVGLTPAMTLIGPDGGGFGLRIAYRNQRKATTCVPPWSRCGG